MDYLTKALAFIFILGAAMTIHEFGHFIVARWLKIRVEIFSFVGLGPRVLGLSRKDANSPLKLTFGNQPDATGEQTDYRISLIPLGAYVKLGGDESNASIEGGAGASDIPAAENFMLRPKWQKIAVSLGGPVANILTALAIPFIGAMLMGVAAAPPSSPVVLQVANNSAAQQAGFQPGDRIVNFQGQDNPSWDDIEETALLLPKEPKPLAFVVERNGQRVNLQATPKAFKIGTEEIGELGITPDYGPGYGVILSTVVAGGVGARGGLQAGDKIISLNGLPVRSSNQATQIIRASNDKLEIVVERNGQQMALTTPVDRVKDEQSGQEVGRLNVNLAGAGPVQKVGITGAARHAVDYNWRIMRLTGKALGQVFSGDRSVRNTVSGPIGIARAAATAAEGGLLAVIAMLGFLSLNLGVFNLLPIPVLDGGAIFIYLVEGFLGLFGIGLTMKLRERIQAVGFVALLLLMGFVITNDVLKFFS